MAERKKRIQRSIQTFVASVRKGNLKAFADVKGGLSRLSSESLQASKGRAPRTATNIAIEQELKKRSKTGTFR